MTEPVLAVRNLTAVYATRAGLVRAVDDVSFEVARGEALGLVGESGCGKSTVAQALLGLLAEPGLVEAGEVHLGGVELFGLSAEQRRRARWDRIALVPQSAMHALNPVYRVGDQIAEAILLHRGGGRQAARRRAADLLELVGVDGKRIRDYPHQFSGGMRQRVVIAMALSCDPQVIVCDEATTGLDVLTEAQVIAVLKELQERLGVSILLISHDLHMVSRVCDWIAIMYAGKIVELAPTGELLSAPRHPYTRGLLDAVPELDDPDRRIAPIPGVVPDLRSPPPGCRFAPRCVFAKPRCTEVVPPLAPAADGAGGRRVACIRDPELPPWSPGATNTAAGEKVPHER